MSFAALGSRAVRAAPTRSSWATDVIGSRRAMARKNSARGAIGTPRRGPVMATCRIWPSTHYYKTTHRQGAILEFSGGANEGQYQPVVRW